LPRPTNQQQGVGGHLTSINSGAPAGRTFEITPEQVGMERVKPEALRGGEARRRTRRRSATS
jgi:hypothetical protein